MRVFVGFMALLAACAGRPDELVRHEYGATGSRKTYELFRPASARSPAPLVVALHRFTESGSTMASMTGWNELASREGFVVVYPNGPGRRYEAFENEDRDDVAMVLAVIEEVAREVPIDRQRVYVTGASNGGFLTHRLACLEPNGFAAAAPVMALMPAELAKRVPDGEPVPMLIIHGTADWIVKESAESVFAGKKYGVLPMKETVEYWVRRNGADSNAESITLPDADPDDGTRVTRYTYAAGDSGAEVRYYRVEGGGHTWPGGEERAPQFIVGRVSRDMSATDVIWEFFQRHSRAPAR